MTETCAAAVSWGRTAPGRRRRVDNAGRNASVAFPKWTRDLREDSFHLPRWMPMTKLLPILPAFGVCFAGGMFLHPVPADHTRSLRVLSQLEAPGDDGYAAWKEEAEKAAARRDTQPQQSAEARDLAAKADQIRAIIGEIDTWFRETDPLIR